MRPIISLVITKRIHKLYNKLILNVRSRAVDKYGSLNTYRISFVSCLALLSSDSIILVLYDYLTFNHYKHQITKEIL